MYPFQTPDSSAIPSTEAVFTSSSYSLFETGATLFPLARVCPRRPNPGYKPEANMHNTMVNPQRLPDGNFQMLFYGMTGSNYTLLSKDRLLDIR